MSAREPLGCRVYVNRRLAEIGMPIGFECSSTGKLTSIDDVVGLASEGIKWIAELTGSEPLRLVRSDREQIGRSFNLYMFKVVSGSNEVGHLRLVTTLSGTFINISGVLFTNFIPFMDSSTAKELLDRGELRKGSIEVGVMASEECKGGSVPVGQVSIPRFVIYVAEGQVPRVERGSWRLTVVGVDGTRREYSLADVMEMSRDLGQEDFHCVTGWSVVNKRYLGVPLRDILNGVSGLDDARWLFSRSVSGYSSVMPLDVAKGNAYIVVGMDNGALPDENGGPARLFSPILYGWKGAKWLVSLELLRDYEDGYWEALAYHERGLAAYNERFKIRNPEVKSLCSG